ncbi:Suppressor of the cold-sensitive snRNP biogenesis mutant brr1-1 [Arthrobotrys musiformis]|uniref:Suppressor of the cold-sensitive snRNP biogenesis mutant brr1-1 n=1 Tax=Arthrobotrys musiformis TaxID=47236 RepID=A0AAV9W9S7_9PEZI
MKLTQSLMAVLAVATGPILVVASPVSTSVVSRAPLLSTLSASDHEIPDSYIIVFKKGVDAESVDAHHSWIQKTHASSLKKRSQVPLGGKPSSSFLNTVVEGAEDLVEGLKHTFDIADSFKGYSGSFDQDTLDLIRSHPDVEYVEKDSRVWINEKPAVESGSPWGLARISHRDRLNFGNFNKYLYSPDAGEGVNAYVIDTGTNIDHVDFEGRANWGKTIPANDEDRDGNGHGTHCSGTIAGKKYGVAKKAKVYAVKVLKSNGSGTMSDVVKGVEWAFTDHVKRSKSEKGFKGSVANMSLGGGKSPTLDKAVNAAVMAGIFFAVAAGNDNRDACNYSPAAAELAVTVGASTLSDDRAYFSNHGKCVDIFAPGLNIQSTWIGSEHAVNTISGTSMASPHIAGLLAYLVSLQPAKDSAFAADELTPKKLKEAIVAIASSGVLSDLPPNTVNLLAYNGGGKSNLDDIFGDRHKQSNKLDTPSPKVDLLDRIEEFVEEEVKAIFDKARKIQA